MYNPYQSHPQPTWYFAGEPLPPRGLPLRSAASQARAERIRRLFVEQCRGRGTIDDVYALACSHGLLAGVQNPAAGRNVVRAALSTIAQPLIAPR